MIIEMPGLNLIVYHINFHKIYIPSKIKRISYKIQKSKAKKCLKSSIINTFIWYMSVQPICYRNIIGFHPLFIGPLKEKAFVIDIH